MLSVGKVSESCLSVAKSDKSDSQKEMSMVKKGNLFFLMGLVFFIACAPTFKLAPYSPVDADISPEIQAERDEIYSLAAYAVVLNDWQQDSAGKRGHNIGSVLVAPDGQVVNWARNCNAALSNGTQHGEVRLMIGYLNRVGGYSLKNHTVYTTLEPCAQCSGMMTLCSIERTVYGQTDPGFGKAMERLTLDSKKWNAAGYEPYPRQVISERMNFTYTDQLDEAYRTQGGSITRFLLTDEARSIYANAANALNAYVLKYPRANAHILIHVQETVKMVKPGIPQINIKGKGGTG